MLFSLPLLSILATCAVVRSTPRKWQGLSHSNNYINVPPLGPDLVNRWDPCSRTVQFCNGYSMQDRIDALSDAGLTRVSSFFWCNLLRGGGWAVFPVIRNATHHCTCVLGYCWYQRLQRHCGPSHKKRQYDLFALCQKWWLSFAL